MDSQIETYDKIKNKACLLCGVGFSRPRAGKLYCSAKCKQFTVYHKEEILALKDAKKGINNSVIKLNLKEYEAYNSLKNKLTDLSNLKRRKESTYMAFEPTHAVRLEELENCLPAYLKKLKLPNLSLTEWSFLKVLYPKLKKEDFNRLVANLDSDFYKHLENEIAPTKKNTSNPIKLIFQNHLRKIAEGNILFT